jgi:hypothetical protein
VTRLSAGLDRPTVEQFLKHARLFGVDCVHETAEEYLSKGELVLLGVELDGIRRGHRDGVRGRERIKKARALLEAGEEPDGIAVRLNCDEDELERLLLEARRGERRRRTSGQRMEEVTILRSQGLTTLEIGDKLGISPERVQRLLSDFAAQT